MQRLTYRTKSGLSFTHDTWCISHLYDLRSFETELEYSDLTEFEASDVDTITTSLISDSVPQAYKDLVLGYLRDHLNPDFSLTFRRSDSKLYVLFLTTFIRACDEEGSPFYEALMASEGHLVQRLRHFYDLYTGGKIFIQNSLHQPAREEVQLGADVISENFKSFLDELKLGKPISESLMYPEDRDTMVHFVKTFVERFSA